ncbi:MAG: hypothetical protein LC687_00905, partial [Actinobacteria bacterium]|nr:hypothetical protein [Actinomycetota bacterium]
MLPADPSVRVDYFNFVLRPVYDTTAKAISSVSSTDNISLMKVVEQLQQNGDWITMMDSGHSAVFDIATNTNSTGEFLSAFQLVEREVPRQILKDVWEINADGVAVKTGAQDWFLDPRIITDDKVDSISIFGSDSTTVSDRFVVGNEIINRGVENLESINFDVMQVTHTHEGVNNDGVVITLRSLTLDHDAGVAGIINDKVTIDARDGDDTLLAGNVPNHPEVVEGKDVLLSRVVDELSLTGGSGDDQIVGSLFKDRIDVGDGVNRVTGGEGIDSFVNSGTGTSVNTLIESFGISDTVFALTDTSLSITFDQKRMEENANGDYELVTSRTTEIESDANGNGISLFDNFYLYGSAYNDSFSIGDFTKQAVLDGTEGGDEYTLTLSGDVAGASSVRVVDSGQGIETDTVILQGSEGEDTIQLDVETSNADYELNMAGDSVTFSYNSVTTVVDFTTVARESEADGTPKALTDQQKRDHIESQIEALAGINDATVSGDGSFTKPWRISLVDVDDTALSLTVTSTGDTLTGINTAYVQRLTPGAANALLAGAPDIDAMFDNPVNKSQVFNRISGTASDNESFTLNYHDTTAVFTYDAGSALTYTEQLLAALQTIDSSAQLLGQGTEQDPWMVTFNTTAANALDGQGNYYLLTLTGGVATDFSNPADIADAAAQTRASGDLASGNFQRVYYNYTTERVSIHGRGGDDTFIADDTAAAVKVYGDQGNDNFLIGRVLKTKTVTVDGQQIQIIDNDTGNGITAGVSYNASFFGGSGDDYFEVNHNVGELRLFGEAGDDTFFLKAHKVERDSEIVEDTGGKITTGAGDDEGNADKKDKD